MEKEKQRTIYLLCLIGFFAIFSTTISKNPVLPLFAKSMGANTSLLGILSALSPLAGMLFSFPVGFLADKWGKRRLLIISALIFVSAPLMYLLVANPWYLIPIRFFHGIATAILGPVAAALICSIVEKNKAQNLGIYASATLVGRMIAPLLGGLIITYFAMAGDLVSYKMVYVAAFVISLPILFLAISTKPEIGGDGVAVTSLSIKEFLKTLKDFGKNKMIFLTALVQMSTYFIYGVVETFLPLYMVSKNISAEKIGLFFSLQVLAIAATQPIFGKIADTVDKRVQITVGILILALATALMPLDGNYGILVLVGLLFGLGMSVATVATSAYVADLSRKEELGSFLGALSSMMDVGQSMGPLLVGFLITAFSISVGFWFATGLAVIILIFFIGASLKRRSYRGESVND
jgi:MFS transporter, DHA1 family, multidrug resistance protein